MVRSSRVTIRDVAVEAGVSHAAVWAALSDKSSNIAVSEKKRAHILEVAKKLNYKPDILAKSFTNKKSYLLGFLANKANEAFGLSVVGGIQDSISRKNYASISFVNDDSETEAKNLQISMDRRIDCMIVNAIASAKSKNIEKFAKLVSKNFPLVEVFGHFIPDAITVNTDQRAIGRIAAKHLIELGHKRIVHFTHERYHDQIRPGTHRDALMIWNGYREEMLDNGLEPCVVNHPLVNGGTVEEFFDTSLTAAESVLNHPCKPTAVVCYNDYEAMALCRKFNEMGVSVPADISIIGSLNLPASRMFLPRLTTIDHCPGKVGQVAAELCFAMMDGKDVDSALVEPELIVGESVAKPRV